MTEPGFRDTDENLPCPDRSGRRWDPVVKMTHWAVAAAVLANALLTEGGSGAHVWIGYGLAAILSLRLLWGFVGPWEARFSAFSPSPRRAIAHVRDIVAGRKTPHRSHNPLGALMVYAIWATLGVIIATGIAMAGPPSASSFDQSSSHHAERSVGGHEERDSKAGGEATEADGEESGLGEVHETAANLLYALILLHIAGVAFETRRSGREILLAMLPARR